MVIAKLHGGESDIFIREFLCYSWLDIKMFARYSGQNFGTDIGRTSE